MTAKPMTAAGASRASVLFPAIAAFAIGFGLIFMSGLVQAETLHDAAHDVRHATGFPCH
ncbi:CbtB-domain containing protein [Paracoccus versutus]|jgi:cobalt transporter subunit CbtB|uniref:Cobalt transporter subunit CbtB n=2 Tax=Paracoccus TaxID=265 RepID=A0A099FMI5_PARVE|nr:MULTISPECIES: CbtB domain-containing protein [Paracoccus]WGR60966.1 CbtB-domain containing protein [Paracoccus ferrooxidans]KGJ11486.1 cobalt transporter [Paracoccus versutus]MBT0779953.1 CbtB-domain containing protein [Paracoccus sp. pheM1]MCJ1898789.1 CbtB-domain containing protein [Paracoccus versutus]MDF3853256.1 CbtB-domain containing protein [Paracoccus pantotrophus]